MPAPVFIAPAPTVFKIDAGVFYTYVVPVTGATSIAVDPLPGFSVSITGKVITFKYNGGNYTNADFVFFIRAYNSSGSAVQNLAVKVVSRAQACAHQYYTAILTGWNYLFWSDVAKDGLVGDTSPPQVPINDNLRIDRKVRFYSPAIAGTPDAQFTGLDRYCELRNPYTWWASTTTAIIPITPASDALYAVWPFICMNGDPIIYVGDSSLFTVDKQFQLSLSTGQALPSNLTGFKWCKEIVDGSHIKMSATQGGAAINANADCVPTQRDAILMVEALRNFPAFYSLDPSHTDAFPPSTNFNIGDPAATITGDHIADLNLDSLQLISLPDGVTFEPFDPGATGPLIVTIDIASDQVAEGTTKTFPIVLQGSYSGNTVERYWLLNVTNPAAGAVSSSRDADVVLDVADRRIYRPGGPAGRASRMEHTFGDPPIVVALESLGKTFTFPATGLMRYEIRKTGASPLVTIPDDLLASGETVLDIADTKIQIPIDFRSADLLTALGTAAYVDFRGAFIWQFPDNPSGYYNRTPYFTVRVFASSAVDPATPAGSFGQTDPFTGLTGGGATNLDGVVTAGLATGKYIAVVVRNVGGSYVESRWFLIAGTAAEDTTAGIVRPDDYNGSTNAKIWVRISGM